MEDAATYLGQKGYTIKKENMEIEDQIELRTDLMVKPFVPKTSMVQPESFPIYREAKKKFYIPRFYGINTYGEPDITKLNPGKDIDIKFNGELRDFQKPIVNAYIKHAKEKGSGLLEIHTGAGKTVMGLWCLAALKKKTLIIVHKEFLLRQWIERIEQFLPKARVGKIQASIIDIEDKDIVIGMLQSLSMKDYDQKIFNEFGFTIVDECHHISAEVFSRVLFKVVTPYALGLSATMKRKDGLTKVLKMFLGEVVYKKERKGEDNVLVKAVNYYLDDDEFLEISLNYRQQVNYTAMMKKICELNHRREFILKVIEDLVEKGEEDTQIMVLGHYKTILTYIYEAIKHRGIGTVGYYIGGMKEKDLKKSEGKKIIIATYAMAEEGLDIKTLTTLVMATPKSDVTQAVGRILRKKRKESVVVDIVDPHIIFQKQYMKRKRFYKKQNFQLKETDMEGYYKDEWEVKLTNKKGTKKNTKKNTKAKNPFLNGVCLIKDDD